MSIISSIGAFVSRGTEAAYPRGKAGEKSEGSRVAASLSKARSGSVSAARLPLPPKQSFLLGTLANFVGAEVPRPHYEERKPYWL
jgi:hypothetical protein